MSDIGGGSGDSWLDTPFFLLQAAGLLFWIVLLLRTAARSAPMMRATIIIAWVLAPGAAVAWNLLAPPSSGIVGAGRFLVGAPATAVNALLSTIVIVRASRPPYAPYSGARLFSTIAAQWAACVLYWAAFLFS